MTATASNKDERVGPSTSANNGGRDRQTPTEGIQADEVMAASDTGSAMMAEGVESENYYTALAGDETGEGNGDTTAEESTGGQSEAPSIRSPHKARPGGTSTKRQRTSEGTRKVIKTTKRKGSRVLGFVTRSRQRQRQEKQGGQRRSEGDDGWNGGHGGTEQRENKADDDQD